LGFGFGAGGAAAVVYAAEASEMMSDVGCGMSDVALPIVRRFSFEFVRHFAREGGDVDLGDLAALLAAPVRRTRGAFEVMEPFLIACFNQRLYEMDPDWFEGHDPEDFELWFFLNPLGVFVQLDRKGEGGELVMDPEVWSKVS
jgi:hypothetical protein